MQFPRQGLPLIFALLFPTVCAAQTLSVNDLTESMTAKVAVAGCNAGDTVQLAYSLRGGGPMQTPYGLVDLTPPISLPPAMIANANGVASMDVYVPVGTGGISLWLQAVDFNTSQLSNSLALVIGPAPQGMVFVPSGSFVMGDHSGTGQADELPLHSVSVSAFWMDACEVTTQEYVDFLNAAYARGELKVQQGVVYGISNNALYCDTFISDYDSRVEWSGGVFSSAQGKKDHPMLKVSWFGACAFANNLSVQDGLSECYNLQTWSCDFSASGYRLATEAEWEYAARGGRANYVMYPWGNSINGSNANYFASGDFYETTWPSTTPVAYYDGNQFPPGGDMANGFGIYDMAGNLYEWVNDWYDSSYYSSSPPQDPIGPSQGTYRILRGGSWNSTPPYLRNALRGGDRPDRRNSYVGFRCVRG